MVLRIREIVLPTSYPWTKRGGQLTWDPTVHELTRFRPVIRGKYKAWRSAVLSKPIAFVKPFMCTLLRCRLAMLKAQRGTLHRDCRDAPGDRNPCMVPDAAQSSCTEYSTTKPRRNRTLACMYCTTEYRQEHSQWSCRVRPHKSQRLLGTASAVSI